MGEWAKFGAISCTHCPHQSERAIEKLLDELKGRRLSHFIHLGDVVEGQASSRHSDDPASHTLFDEFCVAADMLRRIRETLQESNPDVVLVALDGNHDDNIQRQGRIQHDVRSLLDPRRMEGVKDEYSQWRNVKYRMGVRGCYQLGSVIFSHGFAAGANSDELEAIQLAMACGGHAHRLVIRGHTHRPKPPTQCKRSSRILLPWWYANCGYMAFDQRAAYTERFDISQWGRAVIFGEAQLGRVGRMGRDSWRAELVSLD